MPSNRRSEYIIGIAFGGFAALVGIVLSGFLLLLLGEGPIGSLEPFTALRQDGVSPVTAAVWTQFDLLGVHPTVQWDNVTVIRGVLDVLDGEADNYGIYRILPPILLAVCGGLTVSLVRRVSSRDRIDVTPLTGTYISLGYTPLLLGALWLATVPVAPDASGEVKVGSTITTAGDLAGVTAGPTPLLGIVAALVYPLIFGLLGGLIIAILETTSVLDGRSDM